MLVDFAIIGTMKSGTTSLAYQLAQHPQICFSQPKETHFFSTTEHWKKELRRYHAFFDPSPGQICGEASPTYTCLPEYPGTARRLYNYNPDMRLLCIMRQPVQRIVSHYTHRVIRDKAKSPLEVAVFADPTYINRSRYAVQLQPYFDLFPSNNILLLIFEEYVCSIQETLFQIAKFLDVSPAGFSEIDLSVKNPSVSRQRPTFIARLAKPIARLLPLRIPEKLRKNLYHRLNPKPILTSELEGLIWHLVEYDVCRLEEMMGRSLNIWRQETFVNRE